MRLRNLLILLLAVLAVAAGVGLYWSERDARGQVHHAGDDRAADRIDLDVTIEKVDPAAESIRLKIFPAPAGRLAAFPGVPAKEFTLYTSSLLNAELKYPAEQPTRITPLQLDMQDGIVTDYPFDRHRADLFFLAANAADDPLPLRVTLREGDPFYHFKVTETYAEKEGAGFSLRITRSRGTFLVAWMMMIVAWGLALAVLAACRVIIGSRRGLPWEAMAWMAATLFALAGFRNLAPGSPPLGSLIDYAAFLWAEALIACCLVVTVAVGVRRERRASGELTPVRDP